MVSNKRSLRGKLVQFLRYIAIMSENLTNVCPILVLSWGSVGLQVAMTTGTNPKLRVADKLECQVERSAGAAAQLYTSCVGRETRGIEHNSRMRRISLQPSSIGIVVKPRVTMREKLNVV